MNIEHLKKIGNEWTKDKIQRIYFNNLEELIGLEYTTYNTGNISTAKLKGEKISNTKASRLASELSYAKVWFDLADGEFHCQMGNAAIEYFGEIVAAIKQRVADMEEESAEYRVIPEQRDIDGETTTIYSVVDVDGCTINLGHFTDRNDAEYVAAEMEKGHLHGDWVSTLCQGMESWVHV